VHERRTKEEVIQKEGIQNAGSCKIRDLKIEGRTCTRERSSTNLSRSALNEKNLIYASFEGD
jgi:hypothetical protein